MADHVKSPPVSRTKDDPGVEVPEGTDGWESTWALAFAGQSIAATPGERPLQKLKRKARPTAADVWDAAINVEAGTLDPQAVRDLTNDLDADKFINGSRPINENTKMAEALGNLCRARGVSGNFCQSVSSTLEKAATEWSDAHLPEISTWKSETRFFRVSQGDHFRDLELTARQLQSHGNNPYVRALRKTKAASEVLTLVSQERGMRETLATGANELVDSLLVSRRNLANVANNAIAWYFQPSPVVPKKSNLLSGPLLPTTHTLSIGGKEVMFKAEVPGEWKTPTAFYGDSAKGETWTEALIKEAAIATMQRAASTPNDPRAIALFGKVLEDLGQQPEDLLPLLIEYSGSQDSYEPADHLVALFKDLQLLEKNPTSPGALRAVWNVAQWEKAKGLESLGIADTKIVDVATRFKAEKDNQYASFSPHMTKGDQTTALGKIENLKTMKPQGGDFSEWCSARVKLEFELTAFFLATAKCTTEDSKTTLADWAKLFSETGNFEVVGSSAKTTSKARTDVDNIEVVDSTGEEGFAASNFLNFIEKALSKFEAVEGDPTWDWSKTSFDHHLTATAALMARWEGWDGLKWSQKTLSAAFTPNDNSGLGERLQNDTDANNYGVSICLDQGNTTKFRENGFKVGLSDSCTPQLDFSGFEAGSESADPGGQGILQRWAADFVARPPTPKVPNEAALFGISLAAQFIPGGRVGSTVTAGVIGGIVYMATDGANGTAVSPTTPMDAFTAASNLLYRVATTNTTNGSRLAAAVAIAEALSRGKLLDPTLGDAVFGTGVFGIALWARSPNVAVLFGMLLLFQLLKKFFGLALGRTIRGTQVRDGRARLALDNVNEVVNSGTGALAVIAATLEFMAAAEQTTNGSYSGWIASFFTTGVAGTGVPVDAVVQFALAAPWLYGYIKDRRTESECCAKLAGFVRALARSTGLTTEQEERCIQSLEHMSFEQYRQPYMIARALYESQDRSNWPLVTIIYGDETTNKDAAGGLQLFVYADGMGATLQASGDVRKRLLDNLELLSGKSAEMINRGRDVIGNQGVLTSLLTTCNASIGAHIGPIIDSLPKSTWTIVQAVLLGGVGWSNATFLQSMLANLMGRPYTLIALVVIMFRNPGFAESGVTFDAAPEPRRVLAITSAENVDITTPFRRRMTKDLKLTTTTLYIWSNDLNYISAAPPVVVRSTIPSNVIIVKEASITKENVAGPLKKWLETEPAKRLVQNPLFKVNINPSMVKGEKQLIVDTVAGLLRKHRNTTKRRKAVTAAGEYLAAVNA